jgi:hypothetical protein
VDAKARIKSAANGFWDAPLGGSFREMDEKIDAITASGYNDGVEVHDAIPRREERGVSEQ